MRPLRGIGSVIFISFSAVFVVLTFSLSYIALRYVEKAQTDNAANELRVMSFGLVQQVQRYINRINNSIKTLTSSGSTLEYELNRFVVRPKRIEKFLKTKLSQYTQFKSLSVYDPDGICVAKSEGVCLKGTVEKEAFFIQGMKRLTYNDIFESEEEEEKVLLVSAPIVDDNFVLGVLVARINLNTLYDLMSQELALSGRSEAFILDSNLRFITPSKYAPDLLAQSHLARTHLTKYLNEKLWVGEYLNSKDEEVLGTVARIPNHNWYLVVERVFSEIQDAQEKITRIVLVASGALLVVLILITIAISHRITRPIHSLVVSARKLGEGGFDTPIPKLAGPSEISFLAAEFEKMRARISASQGKLKERLEISEQKRVQSERLAAIGTLASSLAHEIRNPLNAMSLLLTQLERSAQPAEKKFETFEQLRSEIIRLDRLVGQILDYAKPVHLQFREVDLSEFLNGVTAFYKNILDQKKISVTVSVKGDKKKVRVDPEKLRQVLVNLIQNSIEAMEHGGELTLEASIDDRSVLLTVRDTGVGIKKEMEGRIYDLFFTTKEKGTGLGLSTVRKIIDAHGGQIDIHSQPGAGTQVQLVIPQA